MKTVEEIFGIKIDNKDYFISALTHPSYTQEKNLDYTKCYERMEFLGDAVLKLAMSEILFEKFPQAHEGEMSKIRSIAVSDNILSNISKKIGLAKLIITSEHDGKQGIKNLESVSACAFEAVLGAYYLDGKFDELRAKLKDIFEPYVAEIAQNMDKYNAKALLQEYTQGLNKEIPQYKLVSESGPPHNKIFTVEVSYRGEVVAMGSGKSKKDAEQKCAYEACKKLGVIKCQE
ncbi:ribonuclease III [bacterium]|nr:ribonuclease III [bacterium]